MTDNTYCPRFGAVVLAFAEPDRGAVQVSYNVLRQYVRHLLSSRLAAS